MGLLDYYRQFEDIDPEEINRELRARRARERALALQEIPRIDLSSTEWPALPNSEIVNASIAAARGLLNRYPDRHAERLRVAVAERHGVDPAQVVVGNGASGLLQTAVLLLVGRDEELVMPWPSHPLFPLLAQRAGARPVAVDLARGAVEPDAVLRAVGPRTRAVVLANPNDPTGTYLESSSLAGLLEALPDDVYLLLDEAYVEFEDVEPVDSCLDLLERFPRLLVFRTFSKIYGLSGLRIGYAVGSPEASTLLASLAPALGVNALSQAGALHALTSAGREIDRRRELVVGERGRLLGALHDLPVDAPPSQGNFVWLQAAGMTGGELGAALERGGVVVAPGAQLGDEDHVRASVQGPTATDRLLDALDRATAEAGR